MEMDTMRRELNEMHIEDLEELDLDEQSTETLKTLFPECLLAQVCSDMKYLMGRMKTKLLSYQIDDFIKRYQHHVSSDILIRQTRIFIQDKLGVGEEVNLLNDFVFNQELAKLAFYYLLKDEEPKDFVSTIITRIFNPLEMRADEFWWEKVLLVMSQNDIIRETLLELLREFLHQRADELLFDSVFDGLLHPLPFDLKNQLLFETRNQNGQTYLHNYFCTLSEYRQYFTTHENLDILYELLSIQDNNGQTILHLGRCCAFGFLDRLYKTYGRRKTHPLQELVTSTTHDPEDQELNSIVENHIDKHLIPFLTILDNEGKLGVDITDEHIRLHLIDILEHLTVNKVQVFDYLKKLEDILEILM